MEENKVDLEALKHNACPFEDCTSYGKPRKDLKSLSGHLKSSHDINFSDFCREFDIKPYELETDKPLPVKTVTDYMQKKAVNNPLIADGAGRSSGRSGAGRSPLRELLMEDLKEDYEVALLMNRIAMRNSMTIQLNSGHIPKFPEEKQTDIKDIINTLAQFMLDKYEIDAEATPPIENTSPLNVLIQELMKNPAPLLQLLQNFISPIIQNFIGDKK